MCDQIVTNWFLNFSFVLIHFVFDLLRKADKPGCNVTLSVSTCFGSQYSFDDLERQTTYKFTIKSHNPSGYSKSALIVYPID